MATVSTQTDHISTQIAVPDVQDKAALAYDSLATGVIFALVLTVGQRVIGFVRGIVFCRLMTDQELGQWSMIWSFLMLLAPLAMLGLPGCFGKYSEHYRQRGQLKTFIYRIGVVSVVMSLVGAAALLLFPARFSELFFRDPTQTTLVICLALSLVAVALSNFAISLLESLRQVRMVTLMRFITGMAFAVVGTILIMVSKNNSAAVTLAYGICCILGMIPALWLGWKFREHGAEASIALSHASMWKKIAPFAVWLWVSNLMHNLFEVSDRYMLLHWSDATSDMAQAMVGQYHSGRVIPLLFVSIAAMLGGTLLPYLSEAWEAGRKKDAVRQQNYTYKLVGLTFTAGGLLVMLTAPFFFHTILQGRYNDGLAVLPMTMVYCVWFSLYTVGQDYLWVAEKGKWATLAVAAGLAANIGLNVLLIPVWGLSGAVVATTLGNLLVILLILVMNHGTGCTTDAGMWLISAIPLLLMLNPLLGLVLLCLIGAAGIRTSWILNSDEKQLAFEAWQGVCRKLGGAS